MIQSIIASGSAALAKLAQVAGQTAEHFYGILVRQQMVEGIGTLISVGLWTIINIIVCKKLLVWYQRTHKTDHYGNSEAESAIFLGILVLFVSFVLVLFVGEAVQKIINPEFYAIKFVFDAVKVSK